MNWELLCLALGLRSKNCGRLKYCRTSAYGEVPGSVLALHIGFHGLNSWLELQILLNPNCNNDGWSFCVPAIHTENLAISVCSWLSPWVSCFFVDIWEVNCGKYLREREKDRKRNGTWEIALYMLFLFPKNMYILNFMLIICLSFYFSNLVEIYHNIEFIHSCLLLSIIVLNEEIKILSAVIFGYLGDLEFGFEFWFWIVLLDHA